MKRTLLTLLAGLSAVAIASSALASDLRMTRERPWQFLTTKGDVFSPPSKIIHGLSLADGQVRGLVTLRQDYGTWRIAITDTNSYHCPNVYIDGNVHVMVWLSSTNQVYETKWEVRGAGKQVETIGDDGDALVKALLASSRAVFRVIDGCDSSVDYEVENINLQEEFASFERAR